MTDWVHCNKCFLRYHPNMKFYVTTCGHLKCKSCVSKLADRNHCLVCNSMCEMVLLSHNLQPDLQDFFRPALESVQKADNVCLFQLNNLMSLLKHTTAKYTAAKTELGKYYKEYQNAKKEQHQLQMTLKSMTRGPQGTARTSLHDASSTPGKSGHTIPPSSLNMTARSTTSSHLYLPFNNPNPPFLPRNQPANAARMMMHRRHPSIVNSSAASLMDVSFLPSHEPSPAPRSSNLNIPVPFAGSPNQDNPGLASPGHGSAIFRSNFHLGRGSKPR